MINVICYRKAGFICSRIINIVIICVCSISIGCSHSSIQNGIFINRRRCIVCYRGTVGQRVHGIVTRMTTISLHTKIIITRCRSCVTNQRIQPRSAVIIRSNQCPCRSVKVQINVADTAHTGILSFELIHLPFYKRYFEPVAICRSIYMS